MNKYLLRIIQAIVSISILIWLLLYVETAKVLQTILEISLPVFIIFLSTYLLSWFFASINAKLILKSLNIKIKLWNIFKIRSMSWCLGQILPGRVGELSMVHLLKKEKISVSTGTVLFILDNLITLFTLVLISILGFFVFFSFAQTMQLIGIIFIISLFIFIFVFTKKGRLLITKYFLRKYASSFKGFSKIMNFILKKHYQIIVLNFLITLTKWIILSYLYYLLIIILGGEVSYYFVFLITAMSVIISLIPISLSGLGVRESIALFLYKSIGVDVVIIMTIQLVLIIFNYLFAAIAVATYKK